MNKLFFAADLPFQLMMYIGFIASSFINLVLWICCLAKTREAQI